MNEITDESAVYCPHKDFVGVDFMVVRMKIDDLLYKRRRIFFHVSDQGDDSEGKDGDNDAATFEESKSSWCLCCIRSDVVEDDEKIGIDDDFDGDDDNDDNYNDENDDGDYDEEQV
jgi:hypothetical protein